jgi:hypothetical protein
VIGGPTTLAAVSLTDYLRKAQYRKLGIFGEAVKSIEVVSSKMWVVRYGGIRSREPRESEEKAGK